MMIRRLALPLVGVVMAGVAVSAPAAYAAPAPIGSDARPIPGRIFADTSFWYQQLPAQTPLDPNSANIVAAIKQAGIQEYGDTGRGLPSLALSTETPLAVGRTSDPQIRVGFNDCQGRGEADPGLMRQISALHVPQGLVPGGKSEKQITLVNSDEDSVTELWFVDNASSPAMTACWGGKIDHASHSSGVFPAPYGATASGLAMAGGMIRAHELASGQINHVVGISVPVSVVNGKVSLPANRTDGTATGANTISEGQLLRLPADLDIDSLHLSAPAKTMAKNAQQYGWIVWDRSGGNSFRIEDPEVLQTDPYAAALDGYQAYNALWGDTARGHESFPFDKLQVVQSDYRTAGPVTAGASQTRAPSTSSNPGTPRPSSSRTAAPTRAQATPGSEQAATPNRTTPAPSAAPQEHSAGPVELLRSILKLLDDLASPNDTDG